MLKLWVWQRKRPPQGIEALWTLPIEGDRGPHGLSPAAFTIGRQRAFHLSPEHLILGCLSPLLTATERLQQLPEGRKEQTLLTPYRVVATLRRKR